MFFGRLSRLALAGAISLMAAGTAEAAKEVRVTIGAPGTHPTVSHGWNPYVEAVEKATNGSLKFRLFLSGSLIPLKATLSGVRDGAADIGLAALLYYPGELPHAKLLADMALLGTDNTVMAGASSEFNLLHCADCQAEFAAQGFVYNGTYATPPFSLITKGKVTTIEDLKGMKIRVAGTAWTRWASHFGAVTVSLPANEMYEGMDRGVIDAAIQASSALRSFSLWDVAKGITLVPLGTSHSISLIGANREFWKGLTLAERTAMIDHASLAIAGTVVRYNALDEQVVAAASEHGVTVHRPSKELLAESRNFARADLASVARENEGGRGLTDVKAKIDRFVELVRKWEMLATPVRDDVAKLSALYKREIFDKLDPKTHGM